MGNNKNTNKWAGGKEWIKGTRQFSEVGLWVEGKAPETEPLYRQDISIMKTHSKQIQRGTEKLDLFGGKYVERELERQGYPAKLGIVIDQLLLEWQKKPRDKNGFIKIAKMHPTTTKGLFG